MCHTIVELLVGVVMFGLLTIGIGYLAAYITHKIYKTPVKEECKDWNKNHIMEFSLFVTGALIWLVS